MPASVRARLTNWRRSYHGSGRCLRLCILLPQLVQPCADMGRNLRRAIDLWRLVGERRGDLRGGKGLSFHPIPPVARVLAHPGVTELDEERLRAMMDCRSCAAVCRNPSRPRKSSGGGSIVVACMRSFKSRLLSTSSASLRT